MKRIGLVVLFIVILGFSLGCIGSGGSSTSSVFPPSSTGMSTTSETNSAGYINVNGTKIYTSKIHFYMYGMRTCPHCRDMHELIPKLYGKNSLTYYELVNNETNEKLFAQIAQLTGITGVPAIAITYNGTLYAVIEGEFNVRATPEIIATAMKNDGMFLFVDKTYLLPYRDEKSKLLIDALYTLFVKHEPVDVQKILDELKSGS